MELYIHIPFCIRKCAYCDFLSAPATKEAQDRYMRALLTEVRLAGQAHAEPAGNPSVMAGAGDARKEVTSVFIGGGTPSSVDAKWICQLMDEIRRSFVLTADAEISMEVNPGTLTEEKLRLYRQAEINRLSMGLQSTDDEELKRLGRIHTYEEFLENYRLARKNGFTNINVDLMSSLPGQTVESYESTLQKVIALNPEHISAYSLIVEEETPFWERYGEHPELLPTEEEDRQMYHRTKEILSQAGYERYEISNYARPGYECRHNTGYWTRVPYLGLGLGASSYYKGSRFANTRDRNRYIEILESTDVPVQGCGESVFTRLREDIQILTQQDAMEEFMFLGLRLTAGIRSEDFQTVFGRSIESVYGAQLSRLTKEGLMEQTENGWKLTEWGLDVSNHVFVEFLLEDDVEA